MQQHTGLFLGKLVLGIVVLVAPLFSIGQEIENNEVIDSLIVQLSVLDDEPQKADVLYEIANHYVGQNCDQAKEYVKLSLALSEKIGYAEGKLRATNLYGEELLFCEVNVNEALRYLNRALQLAVELNDETHELRVVRDIAFAYSSLGEYDNSIHFYQKAVRLAQGMDAQDEIMSIYSYLGGVYLDMGDTASCLNYFEMVLNHESSSNFEQAGVEELFSISNYFLLKEDYANAEKMILRCIEEVELGGNDGWISYVKSFYGRIKLETGNPEGAIDLGLIGAHIAEAKKRNKERIDNYTLLADAYREVGDFESAGIYLEKKYQLSDSLFKVDLHQSRLNYQADIDEVLRLRETEKTKSELVTKNLESENDQLLIRSIAALLLVTFVFLFLLYRRLRKSRKLYNQLEQNQEQLEKLSIVAANIEQMVMIVGNDDRIEWVNNAFEKKFGFLKFESVNRTPYELLGGELTDAVKVKEINQQIFQNKTAFEATLVQYSKSRQSYLTRLHISPILSNEKELERYIVISHDISEEQKVAEELRELSLVASNTTNAIVIFNSDIQVIWVNQSFSEISGLNADAVLGKSPIDIYNGPLLNRQEQKELLDLYKLEKPFTLELESTNRLTNSHFWISMSVTPVFNDDGKLLKFVSVATDITEVKSLEAQYASLVEGSTDMIYEIDISGNFLFVNDVMTDVLGYSKQELRQMHFLKLIPDEHKSRVLGFYENQIKTKEATSYIEFPVLTKFGKIIWVGQRARFITNSVDWIKGFSVVTRDITDQKEIENELKKTYDNANLLSEIGMQITATHSIPEIITQVYGNINKLMDANVFGIAIPNQEQTALIFPQIIENGESLMNYKFDLTDNTRLGVLCFKGKKEILIDDFEKEIRDYVSEVDYIAPVAGEQTFSIIYIPLVSKGKTIGVITVQSFQRNAYDMYQVSLVKSLASFVAIALENATLYETMEEKITQRTHEVFKQKEELEVNYFNTRLLSEIGQLISSTLNLDEIFPELYEKVVQLMDAEIFAVRLYDEVNNAIHFKYTIEKGKRCEPFSISMNETDNYNVWCIQNRKEIFLNDNKKEYRKYVNEIQVLQGEMPNSLIFYPMIVENKMIGVITIQSFKLNAYDDYHLDILKTLASYIGTAIDNATLYDTLEKKVLERTEELEQKNTDITASINYAKRLQKGILPDESFMRQLLPDSFVYFKPKDIVSGDFYWVDRTQSKILFAVVDCTGHGVPGAMMSIIGRNLLDQAVNEKGITTPAQILNFLQVGLSLAFGQTAERKTDLFDGMDLAVCSIDRSTNMLDFAGANNSLYLVQDGELIVLKGDKVGISAEFEISNSYTNLEIEIKKGDVIYLTSDGFPDQFGGPRYKKYTYRKMEELFGRIHKMDISDQYRIIQDEIERWRGDKDQIDDICVMGVRISDEV